MTRWGKPLIISLAAVLLAALTLGAGVVLGGSGSRPSRVVTARGDAHWVQGAGDGAHGLRVVRWGGGPRLGVVIDEVSKDLAAEQGLDQPHGALVKEVEKESPAARAGIEPGDLIVGFGGERVSGVRSLMRMVRETPEGRIVAIDVVRDGSRRSVEAELTVPEESRRGVFVHEGGGAEEFDIEIPDVEGPDIDIRIPQIIRLRDRGPRLGVSIDSMNPQLASFLGVKGEGGVFVREVIEGTPAQQAGLAAGDVILEVDGRRIEDAGDLRRVLAESAGKTIEILVVRDRSEKRLKATIAEDDEREEGRSLAPQERREVERAIREAQRAQQEAMRSYREQMRELERALREQQRAHPTVTRVRDGRVEI